MSYQEQKSGQHPFHTEGENIIFDTPDQQKESTEETRSREQHEFQRSQVTSNKRIALFNGLLVLATVCTIGIGIWQARISRTAANAAESAAETAQKTLLESGRSNAQSLQATIDDFQRDERPWVVPNVLQLILDQNGGSNMTVNTWIVNTGKTPAFDVKVSNFGSTTSYIPLNIDKFLKATKSRAYSGVSNNGLMVQGYQNNVPQQTKLLTKQQSDDIRAHKLFVYTFGDISYTDSFGVAHFTRFCGIYDPTIPGVSQFYVCKTHNFIDRNK